LLLLYDLELSRRLNSMKSRIISRVRCLNKIMSLMMGTEMVIETSLLYRHLRGYTPIRLHRTLLLAIRDDRRKDFMSTVLLW